MQMTWRLAETKAKKNFKRDDQACGSGNWWLIDVTRSVNSPYYNEYIGIIYDVGAGYNNLIIYFVQIDSAADQIVKRVYKYNFSPIHIIL